MGCGRSALPVGPAPSQRPPPLSLRVSTAGSSADFLEATRRSESPHPHGPTVLSFPATRVHAVTALAELPAAVAGRSHDGERPVSCAMTWAAPEPAGALAGHEADGVDRSPGSAGDYRPPSTPAPLLPSGYACTKSTVAHGGSAVTALVRQPDGSVLSGCMAGSAEARGVDWRVATRFGAGTGSPVMALHPYGSGTALVAHKNGAVDIEVVPSAAALAPAGRRRSVREVPLHLLPGVFMPAPIVGCTVFPDGAAAIAMRDGTMALWRLDGHGGSILSLIGRVTTLGSMAETAVRAALADLGSGRRCDDGPRPVAERSEPPGTPSNTKPLATPASPRLSICTWSALCGVSGCTFVAGTYDGELVVWRRADLVSLAATAVLIFAGRPAFTVTCIAEVAPNVYVIGGSGSFLITTSVNPAIRGSQAFTTASPTASAAASADDVPGHFSALPGHTARITAIAKLRVGTFATGDKMGTIRVWELQPGFPTIPMGVRVVDGGGVPVTTLAGEVHGSFIVGASDGHISLWERPVAVRPETSTSVMSRGASGESTGGTAAAVTGSGGQA